MFSSKGASYIINFDIILNNPRLSVHLQLKCFFFSNLLMDLCLWILLLLVWISKNQNMRTNVSPFIVITSFLIKNIPNFFLHLLWTLAWAWHLIQLDCLWWTYLFGIKWYDCLLYSLWLLRNVYRCAMWWIVSLQKIHMLKS